MSQRLENGPKVDREISSSEAGPGRPTVQFRPKM